MSAAGEDTSPSSALPTFGSEGREAASAPSDSGASAGKNWAGPEASENANQGDTTDGGSQEGGARPAWPSSVPPFSLHSPAADLPIANISRIMKRVPPENGKIAKNAKECMQECVSELISFITSEASDRCSSEKRKTINGDDILYSLRVLGFDNYEQVLKVYLSRYRQVCPNRDPALTDRAGAGGEPAAAATEIH